MRPRDTSFRQRTLLLGSSTPHLTYLLRVLLLSQEASKNSRNPDQESTTESASQKRKTKVSMAAKYIVGSLVGSCVIAYACDYIVSQKKIFGGTIPGTVSDKEWWQATDKKFQAWPRTAGPPVVMNPISRQNFIVKDL
uniref:Uncharacterized protein n=1 Tax=Avena sativa TaxID=4498 RepID=A0ACD5XX13_AVESA